LKQDKNVRLQKIFAQLPQVDKLLQTSEFTKLILHFFARKSSNTKTLRNPKEHKGKLELLLLFLSLWTLCIFRVFVLCVLLQLAALGIDGLVD